jgi:hypothetical protein
MTKGDGAKARTAAGDGTAPMAKGDGSAAAASDGDKRTSTGTGTGAGATTDVGASSAGTDGTTDAGANVAGAGLNAHALHCASVALDEMHGGIATVLLRSVTSPTMAKRRPLTVVEAPSVMDADAIIVPAKLTFALSVAELPTTQNTLHACAPLVTARPRCPSRPSDSSRHG